MRKSNSGFTLIEMLVTIAAAALVLVAVSSLLLTGLRLESRGSETVAAQRDSRVVLTMLENIAAEGQIKEIEYDEANWSMKDSAGASILSYVSSEQAIKGKNGGLVMDEVAASAVSFSKGLLTCYVELSSGENYETSVYCRVGTTHQVDEKLDFVEDKVDDLKESEIQEEGMTAEEQRKRYAFLVTLLHEYGSTGKIQDDSDYNGVRYDGLYYSQWFALHKAQENFAKWGRGTPWCSCFLSWALAMQRGGVCELSASVGYTLFVQFALSDEEKEVLRALDYAPENYESDLFEIVGDFYLPGSEVVPIPGDLVFFERDDNDDCPDHIGCVLYVDVQYEDEKVVGGTVYTIEGNNNNRVGVFSYHLDHETGIYSNSEMYIIGYGKINWE